MERHLIAAAIAFAGIAVGAGLYFGLRPEPAPTRLEGSPPAASDRATPPSLPALPSPPVGMGLAPVPSEVQARTDRHAALALAAQKETVFLPRCWAPAVERSPVPATSRYAIHASFDAGGREVVRGVSELRDVDSRPDVAACLRDLPLDLRIPAPGLPVQVELLLDLP
jgi:hypothetical protein